MKKIISLLFVSILSTSSLFAQENKDIIEFHAGLETNHLWRGLIISDMPTVTGMIKANLDKDKHWSLGFWGGTSIASDAGKHYKELDAFVQYQSKYATIGLWDLFNTTHVAKPEVFNYKKDETTHLLDLRTSFFLGETFPMTVQANVLLYGTGDQKINDKGEREQRYSTYVEAAYPVYKGNVSLAAFIGGGFALNGDTHLYGNQENKFDIVNFGLAATKEVKVGSIHFPVNGKVMWNPSNKYVRMQLSVALF